MRHLAALVLITSVAQTQTPDRIEELRNYFELTPAQVAEIARNNEEYNVLAAAKSERNDLVLSEIAEETAREPLDPQALGIRYAEIESNCRQLKERAQRTAEKNIDLMTPVQKLRLQALEEARKLIPLISAAEASATIGTPGAIPYNLAWIDTSYYMPGSAWTAVPGCQVRRPGGLILAREPASNARQRLAADKTANLPGKR
jgi:hypothetical protein